MATIRPFINSCKKRAVFAALVALITAAPAGARVDITATDMGEGEVVISYDASSELNLVRAFALDIRLDNDANIVEVIGLSPDYYIYPGTIQIDAFGNVIDYGTVLAEYDDLPSGTLPGLDSNGITIEMASLYAPVGPGSPNAPAKSGNLVSLKVDNDTCLTISANVARADSSGVVMEDPNEVVTTNLPLDLCPHPCIGCYCGQADYDEWVLVGSPDCWCREGAAGANPRQCHGDADGGAQGKQNFWVSTNDLDILVAAWNKPFAGLTGNQICADFDHGSQGKQNFRVSTNDLDILVAGWNQANLPLPDCP